MSERIKVAFTFPFEMDTFMQYNAYIESLGLGYNVKFGLEAITSCPILCLKFSQREVLGICLETKSVPLKPWHLQGISSPGGLSWVDLDLESSPGWWAGTVASYCPSRMVEHPKSKSTQPRFASR